MMLAALPPALHGDVTNESALAQFTAALRSFRPSATVLEAEIAGVKSAGALVGGGQQLELGRKNTNEVMQRKRATHAVVIEKERKRKQLQAPAAAAAASSAHGPGIAKAGAQGSGTTHREEVGEDVDDEGAGPDSLRAAREAAVKAAAYGDGVLNEGKYRCAKW
ncbi:hypothetical protein DUNSADRAFT_4148 [Dunaliella salina]|uniref:Uncharacterized protein n=1 Tax=Dunaliella salina TaxID=3046 RepID=A0ABQ7GSL4_DUNSA|nr:hypothetical protein DUNSADRAFT_4148 [Dunaliella salina]|eukprot:KAF5837578.1 hypothetical protein DUNSADRAFT_4148 [Dunaliella salina]